MLKIIIRVLLFAGILYFGEEIGLLFFIPDSKDSFIIVLMSIIVIDLLVVPILNFLTIPLRFLTLGFSSLLVLPPVIYILDYALDEFMINGIINLFIVVFGIMMVRLITR